jgi:hypothetical protein
MIVRRAALARLGENAVRLGAPLATIEETLVPLYLHHRYQTEAAVKLIGGATYTYALRGDGQQPLVPVPAATQLAALDAVLGTIDPGALALPRGLLATIPPRPFTFGRHRELFDRWTGLTFDAVSPAAAAAGMSVGLLLHGERAARLVQQHALDPALPPLETVIEHLVDRAFAPRPADAYEAEIQRVVQRAVADGLQRLAADAGMPQVRAAALLALRQLVARADGMADQPDQAARAHFAALAEDVRRYLARGYEAADPREAPAPPPGAPIGAVEP